MAQSSESPSAILQLLDVICNTTVDESDVKGEGNYDVVARGPPSGGHSQKKVLHNILLENLKKKTLIDKIESLKAAVQQRDEMKGLQIMASYLNDILDPRQKNNFMKELSGHKDSEEALKLPVECSYNPSETYIIHNGIKYGRMVMSRFNSSYDNTMIREYKSKNLLTAILTEEINCEKNYIMTLADRYPKSVEEIKFMLAEERDMILRSCLFAYMAQKNPQHLYELLVIISNIIDRSYLCQACAYSKHNGINVASYLQQARSSEMKNYSDQVMRFINRNDQSHLL